MYCDNCGEELRAGSRFCPHCGYENKALLKSDNSFKEQAFNAMNIGKIKSFFHAVMDRIMHLANWYADGWKSVFAKRKDNKETLIWFVVHGIGALILISLIIICIPHRTRTGSYSASYSEEGISDWNASYENEVSYADTQEESNDNQNSFSDMIDEGKDAINDAVEDVKYAKQVLFSSLQGKWMDKNGLFSITFNDDNTLTITDASGVLGADLFTYTEVDNHTISLKAESDNILANIISLNMDYEVDGEVLTVIIAGMTYELERTR